MNKVELDLNLNTLIQFRTSDYKFRIVLGVWGGRLSLTAFGDQPRPVCKVLFNNFLTPVLKKYIAKVLSKKDPSKTFMEVSYFNKETRQNEYHGTVTIGRDKNGVCFLGIADKNNKEGVTTFTTVDQLKINGEDIDQVLSSELGMQSLSDVLTKAAVGEVVTSNKYKGTQSSNTDISTGDDIPF
jgi:hypothetical protein